MKKNEFRLNFRVDLNKDLEIILGFIETSKFFDVKKDLQIGFYNLYPELKKMVTGNNAKQIKSFIKDTYKKNENKIENSLITTNEEWQKKTDFFNKEQNKIFNYYKPSNLNCLAYPTIWGIFPRILSERAFFFPYIGKTKNFISFVIMHELMHFIFYDYALMNHPGLFANLDTERGTFWDLAEVFNFITLSSPEFVTLHKQKNIFFYQQHKKIIPSLKLFWNKDQNIDHWLIKSLNFLNNR